MHFSIYIQNKENYSLYSEAHVREQHKFNLSDMQFYISAAKFAATLISSRMINLHKTFLKKD